MTGSWDTDLIHTIIPQRLSEVCNTEQGWTRSNGWGRVVVSCTAQPDEMGVSFTRTVALPEEVTAVLDSSFIYHIAAQQGKIQRKEPGCSCTLNQADIVTAFFDRNTHKAKNNAPFFPFFLTFILTVFKATEVALLAIWPTLCQSYCSCYVQHLCLFKTEPRAMSKRTWLKDILFLQDLWTHCPFPCIVILLF